MKKEVWQKCPICNGVKFIYNQCLVPSGYDLTAPIYLTPQKVVCPVCNGFGIISILTGLPPQSQVTDLTR